MKRSEKMHIPMELVQRNLALVQYLQIFIRSQLELGMVDGLMSAQDVVGSSRQTFKATQ